MAERENRVSLFGVAGDGLLLLCALMGFTGSFLTLYGNPELGEYASYQATPLDLCAARWERFLLLAALFALLALAAWSLPRFRGAAAGGLALLTGGAAFLNRSALVHGAGLTLHTITALFSRRVSWGWVFPYDPGLSRWGEEAAVRLFLILALALLALALGWAVVRARRWWLAALLTLPPLLPGLLADLYPSWPAFLALCACWCAMLLCDLCKWAAPDRRGRLTLTTLAASAVLLAAISLAFPLEGYTRPQWARDWQNQLYSTTNRVSDFFSRWDGPFPGRVTYVGSAGEADLTSAGPLRYTGRTVLRVTTDYSGRMYLRGASLAVYEGGVWKALPEGTYEEYCPPGEQAAVPLYFPAMQEQNSPTYTVTVDNVGAVGACVYAPYFPTPQVSEDTGAMPVEDAYFARKQGQWTHTLSFVDRRVPIGHSTIMIFTEEAVRDAMPGDAVHIADSAPSTGPMAANRYAGYAYDHYLDVPEELRDALDQYVRMWFFAQSTFYPYSAPGNYPPALLAGKLGEFLGTFCQYDVNAPAAPEGTDPVLYFLNDSRRGYCMHFASAVTLMLRTQGIPARYVSGFTADCQPNQQVDVPDRAAHAWVEVWIDGFGWYPVEVTPAAAFEWYDHGDAQPSPTPSEPVAESKTPEPTPTPEAQATQAPSAEPSEDPTGPEDGPGGNPLLKAVKVSAIIVSVFALLWLAQWLPKRARAKKLSSHHRNRAVLDGYGYLLRLERWGGQVDERAVELAQKAKFSQHTLTEDELAELRGFVDAQRARLCAELGPLKRLAFRFLWGKPPRGKNGKNAENPPENPG